MSDDIAKAIDCLRGKCLACRACGLGGNEVSPGHISNVFSNMNLSARVMVVGQNPGRDEVAQGEPFVGASGRFFNEAVKSILGLDRSAFYISNVLRCLRYNTRVVLEDGTTERISVLVRQKYKGRVMSISPDGHLEPRRVVGWYKSDLANRKMYKLSSLSAKKNSRGIVGPSLTGDHLVLTDKGFVPVERLKPRSRIAIGEPSPNSILEQVIIGSMLGDASVGRASLTENHCEKQREYLEYKSKCLAGFSPIMEEVIHRKDGKEYPEVHLRTPCFTYFRDLRSMFYRGRAKVVYSVKHLTDISVAIWYMDDGSIASHRKSTRAEFATNAYSSREVDYLCRILKLSGFSGAHRVFSNGWRISIGAGHADILFRRIAKYIHPSMRFKLPKEYHDISFFDFSKECDVVNHWASGILREDVSCPEKSVYCIDVEKNHNFVTTGGVVVHNCYTPGNRKPLEPELLACRTILDEEVAILKPKLIIALGAVAFERLTGMHGIMKHHGKVLNSLRYKVPVIPILHPSPYNTNSPVNRELFFDGLRNVKAFLETV